MSTPTRMPRHEVRNDGAGPYAIFYCDRCDREFRSQPQIGATLAKDVGRKALGGLLGSIPLVGSIADRALEDQRYVYDLTPQQLDGRVERSAGEFPRVPYLPADCLPIRL